MLCNLSILALFTVFLIIIYSGAKGISIILLFPSIVLHSTMTFFVTGPMKWRKCCSKDIKFTISRYATYVNILATSTSIFMITLVFEGLTRNEKRETLLLASNTRFEYKNDAYRLWMDKENNQRYWIHDPSPVIKIILLVLPPYLLSLIAIMTLLLSTKYCARIRKYPMGILDPQNLTTQLMMSDGEIDQEKYE